MGREKKGVSKYRFRPSRTGEKSHAKILYKKNPYGILIKISAKKSSIVCWKQMKFHPIFHAFDDFAIFYQDALKFVRISRKIAEDHKTFREFFDKSV